jgi:homoserine dehydrogenase
MPERRVRLGLVGFGSVGRAFAALVAAERAWIAADRGIDLVVTGITTGRSGAIVDPGGVDVAAALERAGAGRPHGDAVEAARFAATCPADVIVETLPLEPFSGAAATAVIRAALQAGRSVASANKGPVAHALAELAGLAAAHGVSYRYESAVADGMPVFNLIRATLPAADITAFRGVLNSTSSLVLDAAARGDGLQAGVAHAQALGVAEADPSHDLDGWDAAVKLASLSAAVWGTALDVHAVSREPVDTAAAERAVAAAARGARLVSIASVERDEHGVRAAVRLAELTPGDDFYSLSAASLGLQLHSRLLCPITISSDDPMPRDTAYGLLADVVAPE